jgi:signal transduction histidine kinase
MKLLIKITSIILFGIIALLAIDGYISVRREVALFDRDMARDGLLLGRTMKDLVAATWEEGGMNQALELIQEVNKYEHEIEIRWVWLDAKQEDPFAPKVSGDELRRLSEEKEISNKLAEKGSAGYRITYVAVPAGGGRMGAIELSEPLTALRDYARRSVIRTSLLTAGMILLSSLLIWLLGIHYIGRPLELLVDKTRQVGSGDFTGDIALPGKEELSNLATALNEMCDQLKTARDTLRRETEGRIEALEQLRHAERLATVGRLASGVAHELGTPLNVVAGRAKIIATEDLDRDEIVSFSKTIADQTKRMTEIIRQLLDFARRRSSQRTPVDMVQLVNQALDLLAVTARKSKVFLEFDRSKEIPPVQVDRSQMQQVLMNLMMNGIQAMPEGGKLEIELSVAKARNPSIKKPENKKHLSLRVRDEGQGIPPEHMKLIFDPFFTTKEVGKGTGLGLSISYGIVEEHGGWIDIQSEVGKGTCFTVYLPMEE